MATVDVSLSNIAGTEAAMGWAGSHTLVADRPVGKAGGMGLGFNGAELLALALGGCYCNDLRYVAHEVGVQIGEISVRVSLELDGAPLIVTSARMEVAVRTTDGTDPDAVIGRAKDICTVANSLAGGFPVTISSEAANP